MQRRFLALRIISGFYKLLGVLLPIAAIGGIIYILIDTVTFPTMTEKLPSIGIAAVAGFLGCLLFFALAQFLDMLMAIEINTRATTKMIQRQGKLMEERL